MKLGAERNLGDSYDLIADHSKLSDTDLALAIAPRSHAVVSPPTHLSAWPHLFLPSRSHPKPAPTQEISCWVPSREKQLAMSATDCAEATTLALVEACREGDEAGATELANQGAADAAYQAGLQPAGSETASQQWPLRA